MSLASTTSPCRRRTTALTHRLRDLGLIALALFLGACSQDVKDEPKWYRGNLHTHSLWSDGDDLPEMIVDWYRESGYDFIALSDHNTLAEGEAWTQPGSLAPGAFDRYVRRFGEDWVEYRIESGDTLVRLKTLEEFRPVLEEAGRFLIIQAEEITDRFESAPVHVNATNLAEFIAPQGGTSVRDVMQRNVDAVLEQRRVTGQPMFPHINHPNFGWAVTAEDIAALEGERFFEVYNGHPAVNNDGDSTRIGTERMWDVILTDRLRHGREVIYGLAIDDAHHYHGWARNLANPGRGWIQVRARRLSADSLIAAMERGDFYASTGVRLDDVRVTREGIEIDIDAEEGVSYRTEFVGTRLTGEHIGSADADSTSEAGPVVGEVLAMAAGPSPVYTFTGDELYVRARIVSSKIKANGTHDGERERAWTQPIL
ncbi:MAG: hypothetical protein R3178_05385, partial [Rhodothermales bacterium]|nr:hypothetical protein [Rhodothermales bacterium]